MSLTIRPATPAEVLDAARQWTSSFKPHSHQFEGRRSATIGSSQRTVDIKLWSLDVIVHDTRPGTALGWVCYEKTDAEALAASPLHYVYVVDAARRKGLGTKLLHHAHEHDATIPTHTTAGGLALLESTRR